MTSPEPTRQRCEEVEEYALGNLEPARAAAFEAHLENCDSCRAELAEMAWVAAELPYAACPVSPPPSVGKRIERGLAAERQSAMQVWKEWRPSSANAVVVVGADRGDWQEAGSPGVRAKRLFVDPADEMVTMLVRMDPGTTYPAHRHSRAEECYVIEGDLRVGDQELRAGDYQRAAPGSVHALHSSAKGCLLLIRSSQDDELLADVDNA